MENNFYDLVYHGYEFDEDSITNQNEFRDLIKKNFPEVKIEDAYDFIKGYRTAIYADKDFNINVYYSFLLAYAFSNSSISFLLIDKDKLPSEEEILKIIREKWPECLKEEYR